MSYLITCSGSKRIPEHNNPSIIENLSFNNELLEARLELIRLTGIGLELDWNKTLPAWQLYSTNRSIIYRQVTQNNWLKPQADIKILSALFGWIKHTDLVPIYDLAMDKRKNDVMPYLFWRDTRLLEKTIFENDIDLLSGVYKNSINQNGAIIANPPEVIWNDIRGHHKGIWLNEQLNLL